MIHRTPPRPGVCIPVDLLRVIDGDTAVVQSRLSGREFVVRFEGVNVAELSEDRGKIVAGWVEEYLIRHRNSLLLHFDWPADRDGNGTVDVDEMLAEWVSFNRTTPELWVNGSEFAEVLICHGYGTRRKRP